MRFSLVDYFLGDKENIYTEEETKDGGEEGLSDEHVDEDII